MIRPVRPDGRIETGGTFKPIPRPRVVERIDEAATQRISVIVAPAGYGKSVALSQFLLELDEPWLRFDLRPEHDTLPGVLRGLAEALEEAAPEARRTLANAYERNRASTTVGADLALWMYQHVKGWRGTIAIDDLHVAEKDLEVLRFFIALIERTKTHIRWIISTRSTGGLPFGTWLAYGDCDLMIDERDLRFTTEEAKQAAAAFKLGVREEELRSLLELTEGWPTALSFALRTSTRSVDLRNITSMTREMIYQYLAEQVYHSLSDEEREFLEATSLLSEIEIDVMAAIGFDRARKLIADLRERVAFLYEVRPGVYRCHDLFRDFVAHQLALRGEASTNRLRCVIAAAMESLARPHAALRLYADAGAETSVLRLIELHGFDLLATGHTDLALRAIAALTEEHRRDHALVLALRGILESSIGRFMEAEPLFRRSLEMSTDPGLRASVSIRLALLAINQGKDAGAILDAVTEEKTAPRALLAEALALRSVVAARSGDAELASTLMDRVESEVHAFEESDSLARTLQRIGVAAWELRQDQRARLALSRSAEMANRLSMHGLACLALDTLALEAWYCENDVAYALWYAQQASVAAGKSGDIFSMQTTALRLLSIELWRGNPERMLALERQAGELRTTDASRGVYIVDSHAYRHAWEGRFSEACTGFESVLGRVSRAFDRAVSHAAYALCLSLDGRTKDSKEEVPALMGAIDAQGVQPDGFASLALEIAQMLGILSEVVAGRRTVASTLLRRRRPLCGRPGAEAMRDAVAQLLRNGDRADINGSLRAMDQYSLGGFARLVEAAHAALRREQEAEHEGRDHRLTEAEIKVLRLLAEGLSPKEIALQTERSVLTVQTHIKHAISKLNCHGTADLLKMLHRQGVDALTS